MLKDEASLSREKMKVLDINNLFDVYYSDFGTIEQPGRWARIGLKAKI